MKNPLELLQYGKEISDAYVRDGKALTDSLVKVAQVHGLNKQEISRVAETANVETYLRVIQKADDKYVEFPLADPKEAYSQVTVKTAATISNDVDEYPDVNGTVDFSFSLYGTTEAQEKTASESINIAEVIQQADRLNGTIEYINNSFMEEGVQLARDYDNIYNLTKQALLSEIITFDDIKELIKSASCDQAEPLITSLATDLKKIMPIYDFEKSAGLERTFNPDSQLYQAVINFDNRTKYMSKIAEAFQEYEQQFENLNTEHKLGITKKASFTSKALTIAAIGAVPLGAYIVGKAQGKKDATGNILNKQTAYNVVNQSRSLR